MPVPLPLGSDCHTSKLPISGRAHQGNEKFTWHSAEHSDSRFSPENPSEDQVKFKWNSCGLHLNFRWTLELWKFKWNSSEIHLKFAWTSPESSPEYSPEHSPEYALEFTWICAWNSLEVHLKFAWTTCARMFNWNSPEHSPEHSLELRLKVPLNIHLNIHLNMRLKFTWSSSEVRLNYNWTTCARMFNWNSLENSPEIHLLSSRISKRFWSWILGECSDEFQVNFHNSSIAGSLEFHVNFKGEHWIQHSGEFQVDIHIQTDF